jgi:hypothetical protein
MPNIKIRRPTQKGENKSTASKERKSKENIYLIRDLEGNFYALLPSVMYTKRRVRSVRSQVTGSNKYSNTETYLSVLATARQVYRTERVHPLRRPMPAAVLRIAIKDTPCITPLKRPAT